MTATSNLKKHDLSSWPTYSELTGWDKDTELVERIRACVELQKRAAESYLDNQYVPDDQAARFVSESALQEILEQGEDVHGISRQPEISNVIVFNAKTVGTSVKNDEVKALRSQIDRMVADKIRQSFDIGSAWGVTGSGHFWYPPGGYMGWHTNAGAPDWRLYIAYAEEPDKSFFRYRDPRSLEIVTAMDSGWSVRLFYVDADEPFWHSVYSQTNRFSLGYRIHPPRPLKSLARKIKARLGIL